MTQLKNKLFRLFLICLTVGIIHAADPGFVFPQARDVAEERILSLAGALEMARNHNPDLIAADRSLSAVKERILQAGLRPNPKVLFEAENIGKTFQPEADGIEYSLHWVQPLELGGKRQRRLDVARAELIHAQARFMVAQNEVFRETGLRFLELLALQEELEILNEIEESLGRSRDLISEMKTGGIAPALDVSRASISWTAAKLEKERAAADLEIAGGRLAAMWAGNHWDFSAVDPAVSSDKLPDADSLVRQLSGNPNLVQAGTEVGLRTAALEREKSLGVPDLELSGGWRHFGETKDNALVLAVSLPLPVFNRNQGKIAESVAGESAARALENAVGRELESRLKEQAGRYQQAVREQNSITQNMLSQAEHNLKVTREGYSNGYLTMLDVLDAQRVFLDVRKQLARTVRTIRMAALECRYLTGQLLVMAGIEPILGTSKLSSTQDE